MTPFEVLKFIGKEVNLTPQLGDVVENVVILDPIVVNRDPFQMKVIFIDASGTEYTFAPEEIFSLNEV